MTEEKIRKQLVAFAQKAYDRCLVRGTGGNFSERLSEQEMVITASGISLGDTELNNLVHVDIISYERTNGGSFQPSKEYRFHADILRLRPDISAVLHVHSPHATAYAVKQQDIPMVTDAAFKQPPLPRVPFAPSGSDDLQKNVARAIKENPGCKALLMEQHGITTLGIDIVTAYNIADLIEELACIAYLSERLK